MTSASHKAWRERNPEWHRAYMKEWRQRNKKRRAEYAAQYDKRPEVKAKRAARARARYWGDALPVVDLVREMKSELKALGFARPPDGRYFRHVGQCQVCGSDVVTPMRVYCSKPCAKRAANKRSRQCAKTRPGYAEAERLRKARARKTWNVQRGEGYEAARSRARRLRNPDKQRQHARAWRERNREKDAERKREYAAAHREELRAYQRAWRAAHPEAVKEYQRRADAKRRAQANV